MKKVRLIAGVTAAIPAAAGGFAFPAAANATQATMAPAQQASAMGKTVLHRIFGPQWATVSIPETLFFRSGGSLRHYSGRVYVTCYYAGNTGYTDPYWDHFTKYVAVGGVGGVVVSKAGHLADSHVDLDGIAPTKLPHC